MERYIYLIKQNKEISDFKITETKKHSYQLFYVDDKLETNRISDSSKYRISVYVDVNDKRGNAEIDAFDYQDDEEIISNLKSAVFNAKLALNPYYSLPNKNDDEPVKLSSNLSERDFKDIAEDIAKVIFTATNKRTSYSAATEIFLNKEFTHIVNSNGLDVSEEKYCGEIELIPTYDTKDKEVEIYHMARFLDFDPEALDKEVNEVLDLVEARFNAVPLEVKQDINVIIDGYEVSQVFDFFTEDLSYGAKYQKNNLFEINEDVQKDGKGDKLSLTLAPYYKGAYRSAGFDNDGIVLKNLSLVENGVSKNRFGSNQFGYYLNAKPSGVLPIKIVNAGSTSYKDMHNKPYIRCVRFSSMQMERMSGFFGGEVRLGFYFDGEKEIPVTGFTISGNMHNLKGDIVYSKEEATYSDYHGPKYLLIPGMNIL